MYFSRRILLQIIVLLFVIKTKGQDTTSLKKKENKEADFGETEVRMPTNDNNSQKKAESEKPEIGIAVSPSTLRFNAKPGTTQTKTFKITNDTKREYNFQVSFQDLTYDPISGQEKAIDKSYKYSLSRYLALSNSYVQLKPRESKVISVIANIPGGDTNAIALWTQLIIDQVFERKPLEIPGADKNTIGFGINAGMGFGIKIFQNPPNVKTKEVEIINLKYTAKDTDKKRNPFLNMKVKNKGDGIGYCLFYIELTNLTTGKQTKAKVKQFSILPGLEKTFSYEISPEYQKGNYSALMVLDFGDPDSMQSAEIDFKID